MKNNILLIFCLSLLTACSPGYIPNPQSIEAQWQKTRGQQPSNQRHLAKRSSSNRINRIAERLAKVAGVRGLIVIVKKDPSWNAAMDSFNKLMIVHTGLIEKTPSDDEVAAVLAHELGHYVFHHSNQRLQAHNSNNEIYKIFQKNSSSETKAQERARLAILLNEMLVNKPAQRNSEQEADSFGIMLMKKAGYDPSAAIRVWWKKHEEQQKKGIRADLLATHPMGDDRIVNLMRTVAAFQQAQ